MAARQAPQLRVFRNDFAAPGGRDRSRPGAAVRLAGAKSNRDAIGARVTVETDRMRRTKTVQAGSGFLSQHSKSCSSGSARATHSLADRRLAVRSDTDLHRSSPRRAGPHRRRRHARDGAVCGAPAAASSTAAVRRDAAAAVRNLDVRAVPGASVLADGCRRRHRSLAALRGKPALVLLWSSGVPPARRARGARARSTGVDPGGRRRHCDRHGSRALGATAAAVGREADPGDRGNAGARPELRSLYRHLFMNRQDLQLPTRCCSTRRPDRQPLSRRIDAAQLATDAAAIEVAPAARLARAMPFPGTFYSPLPPRNFLPYGRELLDQGLEAAAVVAFERAAQATRTPPRSTGWARCSRRAARPAARAPPSSGRSRSSPISPRPTTISARCSRRPATSTARSRGSAPRSRRRPTIRTRSTTWATPCSSPARAEARGLYEKALALQPDFPEASRTTSASSPAAAAISTAPRATSATR